MTRDALLEKLKQYPLYHSIDLGDGLATPGKPEHRVSQQPVLAALRGLDVKGKRVLDIGCRDGLYSIEAERLGAAEVVAFDNDLSKAAVEVVLPYLESKVKMSERNLFDLRPDEAGTFDVIVFAGVLYHLRYPMWAMKIVRDLCKPGALVLIETAVFYGLAKHAMLYCPTGGEGPYEQTSTSFFNRKGLVDSLNAIGLKTLSYKTLHPDAEKKYQDGAEPVIDRATLLCRRYEISGDESVDRYWNRTHNLHSKDIQPTQRPLHEKK